MRTYIIPLLLLLLSISRSFAQGYDISAYLPRESEYALKKVYKVTVKGKPDELTEVLQFDQKGRLQKYLIANDPDLAMLYVYKRIEDGEVCRIYDYMSGDLKKAYTIYVLNYDSLHRLISVIHIKETPDFIDNDTSYVTKTDISYEGHRQHVTHSQGRSLLKAEELIEGYKKIEFQIGRKKIIEIHETKDHKYVTTISNNKVTQADSIYYKNGKVVKYITVGASGHNGPDPVTDIKVITTSIYKGNTRTSRSVRSYTDR